MSAPEPASPKGAPGGHADRMRARSPAPHRIPSGMQAKDHHGESLTTFPPPEVHMPAIRHTTPEGVTHPVKEKGPAHVPSAAELKPGVGQLVTENHEHHALVYIMILGIRTAVSRTNNHPVTKEITEADTLEIERYKFLRDGTEKTPAHKCADFRFQDYAPMTFRLLREIFFDSSEYLLSLTQDYVLSELSSPGKSKSFFYFSKDLKYVIKTMTHEEAFTMRKMLFNYYNYVKENPNTLLTKICGMYRLKPHRGPKIYFHVMQNVFPPELDIHRRYDLKGSTVGRTVGVENSSRPYIVLKDLDFLQRKDKILLGPLKTRIFLEQLAKDADFLSKQNVMDYSLLIGVHNRSISDMPAPEAPMPSPPEAPGSPQTVRTKTKNGVSTKVELSPVFKSQIPKAKSTAKSIFCADHGGFGSTGPDDQNLYFIYCMGIIDFLQAYNARKTMEHMYKGLLYDRDGISAVPPDQYSKRFVDFMRGQTSCDPKDAAIAEDQELWLTCALCHLKMPASIMEEHAQRCEKKPRHLAKVSIFSAPEQEQVTRMCESCHADIPAEMLEEHRKTCVPAPPMTKCTLCKEDIPWEAMDTHSEVCVAKEWETAGMLRGQILKNLGTKRLPKWKSRYYELSIGSGELCQWNIDAGIAADADPRRYPLLKRYLGVTVQPHKKNTLFRFTLVPQPGVKPFYLGCTNKAERTKWVSAFQKVFESSLEAACNLCGQMILLDKMHEHSATCHAQPPAPPPEPAEPVVKCAICHEDIPLDAVAEHSRVCSVKGDRLLAPRTSVRGMVPSKRASRTPDDEEETETGGVSGAVEAGSESSGGQTWASSMCSDSETESGTYEEGCSSDASAASHNAGGAERPRRSHKIGTPGAHRRRGRSRGRPDSAPTWATAYS